MKISLARISTSEAIVNHFIGRIENGEILPGDQLPSERLLQQQFGISRFSLREGLAKLSALGIIRIIHGKGAFVNDKPDSTSLHQAFFPVFMPRDTKTFEDLFDARMVIECETAVRASRQREPEDIILLEKIMEESRKAIDDADAFGKLDFTFHRAIASAGKNIFLERMLEVIQEQIRTFLLKHAHDPLSRNEAFAAHVRIFEKIRKGDGGVTSVIKKHILACKDNYLLSMNRGQ